MCCAIFICLIRRSNDGFKKKIGVALHEENVLGALLAAALGREVGVEVTRWLHP
jgi:hypothetical protein